MKIFCRRREDSVPGRRYIDSTVSAEPATCLISSNPRAIIMGIFPRTLFAALVLLISPLAAFAVDGVMGIVTGNPGKIMDGEKVLAEVPKGTRLWVFSEKPGWAEVKVPNEEQHGWLKHQLTIHNSQKSKMNSSRNQSIMRKNIQFY